MFFHMIWKAITYRHPKMPVPRIEEVEFDYGWGGNLDQKAISEAETEKVMAWFRSMVEHSDGLYAKVSINEWGVSSVTIDFWGWIG